MKFPVHDLFICIALATLLASCAAENNPLPVSRALVLDLNADLGVSTEEDSMVTSWTNQAPNPRLWTLK